MGVSPVPEAVAAFVERVRQDRKVFLQTDPAEQPGTPCMQRHAEMVDAAMRSLYQLALGEARASHGDDFEEGVTEIAIVATGGYGRQELAPFSDIDIAFVPSHEDNPFVDALLSRAFRLLVASFLDATDLEVGYGFRPLSDLPSLDHQTKTSLLDSRLVIGSRRLFDELQSRLIAGIDVVSYLQEKATERVEQTARPGLSVYAVEPDLKTGPGGLRDLQSAMWMAQVSYGTTSRRRALESLVEHGVVQPSECQAVRAAEEHLHKTRTWLHLHGQQKQDVLLSDVHGEIGRAFGYEGGDLTAGQRFMQHHYTQAAEIRGFAAKVCKQLLWGELPLSDDFVAFEGRLRVQSPSRLRSQPELAVSAYRLAQRYRLKAHPDLDRLLDWVVPMLPADGRLSPATVQVLLEFLADALDDVASLRDMSDRGLLRRLLPEMGAMMTLVPADPSHEVTVGEHALRVVAQLADIAAESTGPPSLAAEVFGEIDDPALLALAALLHDVGKARGGGDHSVLGAETAAEVAERLELGPARTRALVTLVREHLLLSRSSRLLNLNDPATLRNVAAAVGDRETLRLLYLLSYADTKAVGASSYTRGDLDLLGELYVRVVRFMTDSEGESDWHEEARRRREEVYGELASSTVSADAVARLCEALPPGYLLNTPLGALATHASFLAQLQDEGPVIDLHNGAGPDHTELTLCLYDAPEPGLLGRVTGTLYANEVDIHSAQVFTIEGDQSVVLDTLWVSHRGRRLSETKCSRLSADLRKVAEGSLSLEDLLTRAGKPMALRATVHDVKVSNALSDMHTVIHVTADDVPGLLHLLTRSLSTLGLDIHVAKITTWAGRAEDSFYVSCGDGHKLGDSELPGVAERLRRLVEREETEVGVNHLPTACD